MKNISTETISELLHRHYGVQPDLLKKLVGELDQNYFVGGGDRFIFKLAHVSRSTAHLEMENQAMQHLVAKALPIELPYPIPSNEDKLIHNEEVFKCRLLHWVDGSLWSEVNPHSGELLYSLGSKLGILTKGLLDFDHAQAHRFCEYDPSVVKWTLDKRDEIPDGQRLDLFDWATGYLENLEQKLEGLRRSVIYMDANDNNIIVSTDLEKPGVAGFIDFGDLCFTHTINDLAVALAYACMDKVDPVMIAFEIVRGYHQSFPIKKEEIKVLYDLVLARLINSVTSSAIRKEEAIENPYLLVSESAGWKLIEQWKNIHPHFAASVFRHACGWEPCSRNRDIVRWLSDHHNSIHPVLGFDLSKENLTVFDWSVGSLELGNFNDFQDLEMATFKVFSRMAREGTRVGIGRYDEPRPVYSTDEYAIQSNDGPQWRSIHIGIDLFMPAGTPIYAPLNGEVITITNDVGDKEYGPLLILKHQEGDLEFYTLYGHNDPELLDRLKVGDRVKKGEQIALMGNYPENGNWVPHLHFQIMTDMLDYQDDYPGVARPDQIEIWKSLVPDANLMLHISHPELKFQYPSNAQTKNDRKEHLGPSLSTSYDTHLFMSRGYMQYLYSAEGRRYLDTVNNVPHVGHQHPRFVEAIRKQMSVLNTNTRYLHKEIVSFAEELKSTLPDHLEVVYCVNSGSEANELALRMAKTVTGRSGVVALDQGYHGNTGECINVSSYKFDGPGGKGAPDHVSIIPPSDPYRNQKNNPKEFFENQMQKAIDQMAERDFQPAAFIHETILSCAGQVVPEDEFFNGLYSKARSKGIVTIADEVQTGVGRLGHHFWAFQMRELHPDIVTIGKPIGNGHPLGVLVTTREIAETFSNGMEFFSTFGGNPVSCAAGNAVLKIVREEGLQEHALEMEKYLYAGFGELARDFPIIGDIRGYGLFLGIELINDLEKLTPAGKRTHYLINRMKENGVLMSSDGPHHNVLKIKPPLCFNRQNADLVLERLRLILNEDVMRID